MVLSNKEWLDKMDEIISAIQNNGVDSQVIMDMLSNMWSSSVTYNAGDYVLYNNNIWKCLIQNSNIAPTESSTWTSVKITNEISTLNSNFNNYEIKILTSTETTSNVGTFSFNYTNEIPNGGTLLLVYTANSNYWCKLYGLSNGNCVLGISDFNNQNSANTQHTVYSYWLVKNK